MSEVNKSYSRRLADYLAGIRYEEIPADVIEQAKKLTLHVLAASIGSLPVDQSQKAIRMAQAKGGIPQATVWGSNGVKVPIEDACFANGTMADVLDWEDCAWTGHPSAGVIPAALAIGEAKKIGGKDYLTSIVTAYEGYQRIGMYCAPTRDFLNSHGNGLVSWQIFAPAIAAAKLLGMDGDQIDQVFGAALYNACVGTSKHARTPFKSDIYHYSHGWSCRNGVVSAFVTEAGYENCRGALDGGDGYWCNVSDSVDMEWLVKDYYKTWYITTIYLKHWPANMWVQTPLEIMDEIMHEHPFTLDEVDKIRFSPQMDFLCMNYSTTSRAILDAQFSIPYCLTAYIVNNQMGAHWFTEEMRNDPKVIAFASAFEYFGQKRSGDDNFDEFKAGSFPEISIEVLLKDGTKLERSMRYPKGHPRNNFTLEEECDHFRMCCKSFLPAAQIEKIIELVCNLENLDDVSPIAELTAIHGAG